MPKHIFFDLDNTLTPSKSSILPEHLPLLKKLCDQVDVIVVSGHGEDMIQKHLGSELHGRYSILGQNGNHAETRDGKVLWNHSLSGTQKNAILDFAHKIQSSISTPVKDPNDLVEDRDSQIAYSIIGHHEELQKKYAYDPDGSKRIALLKQFEADQKALHDSGVEVTVAGTTCLDFYMRGKNKGFNIAAFIEAMGWNKSECMYVGDALEPGRNDESVIGVIPTKSVKNPDDTFIFIKEMLL